MLTRLTAGPVGEGTPEPCMVGVERVVRSPRRHECMRVEPCPICNGSGTAFGWTHGERGIAPCRRCAGRGRVEGVLLLRLVSDDRAAVVAFAEWASANHLRLDQQLALREEGGAAPDRHGWSLLWSALDGSPLPVRGKYLAARHALGVSVEANAKVEAHVAVHALDDEGTVHVVGLWDISVNASGGVTASWADQASRQVVRDWRIAFPEAALRAAVERARCLECRHDAHFASATRAGRRAAQYACQRRAPALPDAAS
jgi:hypothetical protein